MSVLAIDPGSQQSAWLIYDGVNPVDFAIDKNEILLRTLSEISADHLAIEYMRPRGMPTSKEEMDTQFVAGRFVQAWGGKWSKVYRKDVKMHLCNSMRAKDSNIRQALLDRFAGTGGGKTPQIGTKNCKGPLYGVKADIWSALAVAVTFSERQDDA